MARGQITQLLTLTRGSALRHLAVLTQRFLVQQLTPTRLLQQILEILLEPALLQPTLQEIALLQIQLQHLLP
jgi:hypothetical protein